MEGEGGGVKIILAEVYKQARVLWAYAVWTFVLKYNRENCDHINKVLEVIVCVMSTTLPWHFC